MMPVERVGDKGLNCEHVAHTDFLYVARKNLYTAELCVHHFIKAILRYITFGNCEQEFEM
jgi:hypothetical protein